MNTINLGFKAYDVHELLCHSVAEAGGMHAEAGIRVKLVDTSFVPDDALPDDMFHVACAAVLVSFLSGQGRKVCFVACDRPMFWLYGQAGVDRIDQLADGQVATFPEVAPPAKFLRQLLQDAGITTALLPSRDDVARMAMLASGSVDAALLSSCFMPGTVDLPGCKLLAFVGENLRLPSSGLAVSDGLLEQQPGLVADMVGIYRQAMKHVFDEDQTLLRRVLVSDFRIPSRNLDRTVQIIRDCYNPLGYSPHGLLQAAVDNMAASLGRASKPARGLYDFRYLKTRD